MDNYFELNNPDTFECTLIRYESIFPILAIKLRSPYETYRLTFQQPFYINAPIYWTGANFVLGTVAEKEKLAKGFTVNDEAAQDIVINANLFKTLPNASIRGSVEVLILALTAKLEVRHHPRRRKQLGNEPT